jgi:hypothetical protein
VNEKKTDLPDFQIDVPFMVRLRYRPVKGDSGKAEKWVNHHLPLLVVGTVSARATWETPAVRLGAPGEQEYVVVHAMGDMSLTSARMERIGDVVDRCMVIEARSLFGRTAPEFEWGYRQFARCLPGGKWDSWRTSVFHGSTSLVEWTEGVAAYGRYMAEHHPGHMMR